MLMWSLSLIILIGEILVNLTDASCVQNNRTYEEGETWHPILHPFGVWRCANCSCLAGTITCVNEKCPPVSCDEPKMPAGGCCHVCEVTKDKSNGSNNGRTGCSFEGKHYADGAVFSSNSTGISPNMESQCVNCNCLAGNVLCRLKTCDIPRNCRKLYHPKDDCCPRCADNSKALLGTTELLYTRDVTHNDCQTIGEFRLNGSEWRPSIGRNCITCTCVNGEVDCNRVDCNLERLSCSPEKRARGECCNRCLKSSNIEKNRSNKRKCKSRRKKNKRKGRKKNGNGNRRRKSRRGRKKNRRNRKNRRRQSTLNRKQQTTLPSAIHDLGSSGVPIETTSFPNIFKSSSENPLTLEYLQRLCMPDDTDKIIYRHSVRHHGVFVAFDDRVSDHVEVLWWNYTRGNKLLSAMETYRYPAGAFRQHISEDVIIGAASNREIKTFKRKLKRQMTKCLKKNKCRPRVIKRAFFCFEIEKVTPNCALANS